MVKNILLLFTHRNALFACKVYLYWLKRWFVANIVTKISYFCFFNKIIQSFLHCLVSFVLHLATWKWQAKQACHFQWSLSCLVKNVKNRFYFHPFNILVLEFVFIRIHFEIFSIYLSCFCYKSLSFKNLNKTYKCDMASRGNSQPLLIPTLV